MEKVLLVVMGILNMAVACVYFYKGNPALGSVFVCYSAANMAFLFV